MGNVVSNVTILISGINLKDNFQITKSVYQKYISDINCTKLENNVVDIKCKITSEDKNINYLVANTFKEFALNLFSMFGVNIKLDDFKIDTDNDFLPCSVIIRPPLNEITGDEINSQADNVINSFSNSQMQGAFHNLIEANKEIDMIHRFRALFSVFDYLSPKDANNSIKYRKLGKVFEEEIKKRYYGACLARYIEITNELMNANLIDVRANKNYSKQLQNEMRMLNKGEHINESVSFSIMKCIQITRNKLNHGDFVGITPKIISGAYELLLVITQRLIKK